MTSNESAYAYAYGVVSSMTAKLMEDKKFDELSRFRSVEEILAFLEGTDYEEEIKRVAGKTIDVKETEKALERHFIRVYGEIVSSIPEKDRSDFDRVMLERFREGNLKIIMRGIHSGMGKEEIAGMLGTETDGKLLEDLAGSETLEEFAEGLSGTPYHKALWDRMPEYNESGSLLPLENSMDRCLVESWREVSSESIREFVDMETDVINIMTILRCMESGLPAGDYVIKGGSLEGKLDELVKADKKGMASLLENTPYGEALNEVMRKEDSEDSLARLESVMEAGVMKHLRENALLRPLGVSSVMLFINSKRREVRNLRSIIVCKHHDIPPEEMKEILM